MTMAASTMAPMAMAMPPSDRILALMPCQRMMAKAAKIPIGRLIRITSEERR